MLGENEALSINASKDEYTPACLKSRRKTYFLF